MRYLDTLEETANHRTCIYDVGYPPIQWLYFDCARSEKIVNRSETSSYIANSRILLTLTWQWPHIQKTSLK
jgi:hypothetical protein